MNEFWRDVIYAKRFSVAWECLRSTVAWRAPHFKIDDIVEVIEQTTTNFRCTLQDGRIVTIIARFNEGFKTKFDVSCVLPKNAVKPSISQGFFTREFIHQEETRKKEILELDKKMNELKSMRD